MAIVTFRSMFTVSIYFLFCGVDNSKMPFGILAFGLVMGLVGTQRVKAYI